MNKIEQSITEKYDNYLNLIVSIVWNRYQIGKNEYFEAADILHDILILITNKNVKVDNAFIYIYRTIHYQLITPGSVIHTKYILPIKTNVRVVIEQQQEEQYEEKKEIGDVEQKIKEIKEKIIKTMQKSNLAKFRYTKTIFELYYLTGLSLRDIQKQTKIPYSSIFKTVKDLQIEDNDKNILKLYKNYKKKQFQN